MASTDTPSQLRLAEAAGWKGFVVTDEELAGVVLCDNTASGKQCIDCLRCNGSTDSVRIAAHGARQNSHPSRKGK